MLKTLNVMCYHHLHSIYNQDDRHNYQSTRITIYYKLFEAKI